MQTEDRLEYKRIAADDVEEMTKVMKRAFDEDTRIHLGRAAGGPPGYDNGEFIRKWYLNSGSDAYKIMMDGKICGGYNIFLNRNHVNFLGNIFIDPAIQNKGIGLVIWKHIEEMYPDTVRWCTDTPAFSKRNHNFYINKCGFKLVKIENPKDLEEASYILEKDMK